MWIQRLDKGALTSPLDPSVGVFSEYNWPQGWLLSGWNNARFAIGSWRWDCINGRWMHEKEEAKESLNLANIKTNHLYESLVESAHELLRLSLHCTHVKMCSSVNGAQKRANARKKTVNGNGRSRSPVFSRCGKDAGKANGREQWASKRLRKSLLLSILINTHGWCATVSQHWKSIKFIPFEQNYSPPPPPVIGHTNKCISTTIIY